MGFPDVLDFFERVQDQKKWLVRARGERPKEICQCRCCGLGSRKRSRGLDSGELKRELTKYLLRQSRQIPDVDEWAVEIDVRERNAMLFGQMEMVEEETHHQS